MEVEKEASEVEESHQKLERHYFDHARRGIILSEKDLRTYCDKVGLMPRPTSKMLRQLRYRWKYIAVHARWSKEAHYVGSSIDKLGNIMVDVGRWSSNPIWP